MPLYYGLQRIGLQILCFLIIVQCMVAHGALPAIEIRDALQGEALGIENSGSREPVRKYLESVPHFAQQVTIFPELAQKDSLKNEFIHLTEYLQNFEKGKEFLFFRKNDQKSAQDILEQRNHLMAFHQLVLGRVQQKIIDSNPRAKSSQYVNVKKDALLKNKITRDKWGTRLNKISGLFVPQKSDYKRENHTDVMVIILEKSMIGSLSKMLLDIDSLKSKQPSTWHPTYLKLTNHVFQIVAYLYKHSLITEESFKEFCDTDGLMEIAATSMVQTFILQYKPVQIGLSKIMPNYSNLSHYRIFLLGETLNYLSNMANLFIFILTSTDSINLISQPINHVFKGLERCQPHKKRYFSYLSLQRVLNDSRSAMMKKLSHPLNEIHFDRKFFGRLEKYIGAKLNSKQALESFKTSDPDYIKIKKDLGILVKIYMISTPTTYEEQFVVECRPAAFLILEFVQDNYGEEILQDDQTDQLLRRRMDSTSAFYQTSAELLNIIHYLEGGVDSDIQGHKCLTDIESGKKNIEDLQEEFSLISRYVDLIIQKNQDLVTEHNWKGCLSDNEWLNRIQELMISKLHKKALEKIVV
ncbi:hypothetical protein Pst134EA_003306 [Puccinia striiformis f. sp. tritici]|uniref:hypothetical protein n=1 Tax=Puccinia striiformis f. sp. tritici TaxID=168172 RepID=UPI0020073E48|nr:hypothetical protein Pst134EA_003306 [Puccinia striiformis f. sp. tritici]KAH9472699.1 hypothetical protein Pst134EA_003306 [Puccinia striiformis f. sp. tritici]